MADVIATKQACQSSTYAHPNIPAKGEISIEETVQGTIMEQSLDPDGNEPLETKQSKMLNDEKKVYIGNLRLDVEGSLVIKKLKELFSKVDIIISDESFSMLLKGQGNSRYLFATLKNGDEVERAINYCNGFKDSEITVDNNVLKVCLRNTKHSRRRRKRRRRSSLTPVENDNTKSDISLKTSYTYGYESTEDESKKERASEIQKMFDNIKEDVQSVHHNSASGDYQEKRRELEGLERSYPQSEHEGHIPEKFNDIPNGDWKKTYKKAHNLGCSAGNENKYTLEDQALVPVDKKQNIELQEAIFRKDTQCSSMPNLKMSCNAKRNSSTMVLVTGQTLPNEDRRIEYKIGSGKYLKNYLIGHVRKYSCAFLNSEGGRLLIGVADDGKVRGIPCNRSQEDLLRQQIDCVIGRFHPPVFPHMYSVRFIPVISSKKWNLTNDAENSYKVLQIKIEPVHGVRRRLYETDKGEVFVRRDGSVQGPLKASQIIDWCTLHNALEDEKLLTVQKPEDKIREVNGQRDFATNTKDIEQRCFTDVMPYLEKQVSTHSLRRLHEIEASIIERQKCIERDIASLKSCYKARKEELKAELRMLRHKHNKARKPRWCIIL